MLKKTGSKNVNISKSFNSLIGEHSSFKGDIKCEGAIRIDGEIIGEIKAAEDVVIGPNAKVEGDIYGNIVQISGIVKGNIFAKYTVRLCTTASLYGDIETQNFITEEGSFFLGKCTMTNIDSNEMNKGKK
jgi:cytoskeletal protein CcmA (bactofilin family)